MTERRDEVDDFPLLPSVEPALRVPTTDEDLTDAIKRLVERCAQDLATSGMSAPEGEIEAVEMVAEAVGLPVEEVRRRVEVSRPPSTGGERTGGAPGHL